MRDPWMHVGRPWTNGEPFLAFDAALRGAWHGFNNDDYDQDGDALTVGSDELAIFSAAIDGTGSHSAPLVNTARTSAGVRPLARWIRAS
jgi:hypothetical protein